jgi:hypothetical protein
VRARARSAAGQASADYVALLAVVGSVLAGTLAVVALPALAPALSGAIRHGICLVAGGVCTPGEARAAGMEPCLVHARGDREQLAATAIVVRLGRDDELLLERRSDGTAAVSFIDGRSGGLEAAIGLRLKWGQKLEAGAGAQFTGGRTWEFPTAAAARRFVHRWARDETLTGELRSLPRRLCLFCRGRPKPPPPQATYHEAGAYGEFTDDIGLPGMPYVRQGPGLSAEGSLGAVVGRRVSGARRTWYARIDASTAGRLGAVLGAVELTRRGDAALELTFAGDRPVEMRVRGAAALRDQLDLLGATTSLEGLAARLRLATDGAGGAGAGLGVEAQVSLDLTDERNRRAALDFVGMLRPGISPGQWDDRTRALAQRLDADGSVDVGVFRVGASSQQEFDAGAAFGVKLGGEYRREVETRELLRAWSLRHGGALGEREDCVSA